MKIHDVEQGSETWVRLRLGLPTCSRADELVTPAKLKMSASSVKYRNQLLAEYLVGHPVDWGNESGWLERGREMEAEGRNWYELNRDCEVRQVGFVMRDDGKFGGSPDGLVGDAGGVEIKVPALHTHIGYLLDNATLAKEYRGQVQSYLYLTGRAWWDLIAYNPDVPSVCVRVEPDPEYQAALESVLAEFLADLERCRELLAPHKLMTMDEARAA